MNEKIHAVLALLAGLAQVRQGDVQLGLDVGIVLQSQLRRWGRLHDTTQQLQDVVGFAVHAVSKVGGEQVQTPPQLAWAMAVQHHQAGATQNGLRCQSGANVLHGKIQNHRQASRYAGRRQITQIIRRQLQQRLLVNGTGKRQNLLIHRTQVRQRGQPLGVAAHGGVGVGSVALPFGGAIALAQL